MTKKHREIFGLKLLKGIFFPQGKHHLIRRVIGVIREWRGYFREDG
jgi:hypothetical protein